MTEDEARKVQQALTLAGVAVEAAPLDPSRPDSAWRLWRGLGDDRRDVTLTALDALVEKLGGDSRDPGWHDGQPVRGFIFPEHGRG